MLPLPAVQSLLTKVSAVTAIVGDRIYYLVAPEDVKAPYLVLRRIQTDPERSLDVADTGNDSTVLVIENWAATYADATRLSGAVNVGLIAGGLQMQLETDDYDDLVRLFAVTQHWIIWV